MSRATANAAKGLAHWPESLGPGSRSLCISLGRPRRQTGTTPDDAGL